jgi:hypothetical protein
VKARPLTLILAVLILFTVSGAPLLADIIVYNNLPNPMPPASPSLGFQANQTAQFGDLIHLVSGPSVLTTGTILMTDWALHSDFPLESASGFNWPLTLTLYNVDSSSGTPQPGSVITSVTQTFVMAWRPAATGNCANASQWSPDGGVNCFNGFNFLVNFNLPSVTVPGDLIFGITYNTETWGPNPTGIAGPYTSLNLGLNTGSPPTVGSRPLPDTAYWNTQTAGNYTDGGAGGVGTFRQDTAWSPYSTGAEFIGTPTATPEPGTLGFLCCGGIVIGGLIRRKRRQKS